MSDNSRYTTSEQGLSVISHEGRNLYVPGLWKNFTSKQRDGDLFIRDQVATIIVKIL